MTLILHCPKKNLNVFVKKTEPVTVGAEATDYIHGFCARQIYCKQKPDIYRGRCQRSKRDMPGFHAKILIITLRIEGHFYKKKRRHHVSCVQDIADTQFSLTVYSQKRKTVCKEFSYSVPNKILCSPHFSVHTHCVYTQMEML